MTTEKRTATMGGKPREHWERVIERVKGLVITLDEVRDNAIRKDMDDAATRAANDIDALLDVLVVMDFQYNLHFGERPAALSRKPKPPVQ